MKKIFLILLIAIFYQAEVFAQKSTYEFSEYTKSNFDVNEAYKYALLAKKEERFTEAIKYYKIAAGMGSGESMNNLGVMYSKGLGVDIDYIEALNWYKKAIDNGVDFSMVNYGAMYYYGRGVTKNYNIAVEWYLKAANKGIKEGMFYLASCYFEGNGVDKDLKKYFYYLLKAAEAGYIPAYFVVGEAYSSSYKAVEYGIDFNEQKATYWFEKSADYNDSRAMVVLGQRVRADDKEENYDKKLYWFSKAVEIDGNVDAMYELGNLYYISTWAMQNKYPTWSKKSNNISLEWFVKAASKGHVKAMSFAAMQYDLKKDYKTAFNWYLKAAQNGDKEAMVSVINRYETGQGVIKNKIKANEWQKKYNAAN